MQMGKVVPITKRGNSEFTTYLK